MDNFKKGDKVVVIGTVVWVNDDGCVDVDVGTDILYGLEPEHVYLTVEDGDDE